MNKITVASGTSQQTLQLSDNALALFGEAVILAAETLRDKKKLADAEFEQFEFIGKVSKVFAEQKNNG
jgi:hypothetical protein